MQIFCRLQNPGRHNIGLRWRDFFEGAFQNCLYISKKILSRANGNFEERNKVLESSVIVINYCTLFIINIIITPLVQFLIIIFIMKTSSRNAKGTKCGSSCGLLLFPDTKADIKTFCPMSRIRPVTARPAPQR